ncbi:MAG: AAA family ATPase [Burkholderiaceae bacterium]|nr:AAA family ATPase [Burkholderiaceae bacterium]
MNSALKNLMYVIGLSQGELSRETGLSKGTINQIVTLGRYPKGQHRMVYHHVVTVLKEYGASGVQLNIAMAGHAPVEAATTKNKTPGTPHAEGLSASAETAPEIPRQSDQPQPLSKPTNEKEDPMLLRKQTLSQATKLHFKLFKDPFTDDVQEAKDVFLTPDVRYVREAMWSTVKHGGLLAVTGESGSGKSTLRRDLADRIVREQASVVVIEPYVLAMEENDMKGKTLKSAAIAESIITAISPLTRPMRSAEARFRQLHTMLKDSHRAGNRHVLVIEEAHCLPTATLKHLKRFFELEDGFKKLLSIILIGQPELRQKLSEKNPEVREVVQRCEVVELPPLDNNLQAYLDFKMARVGGDMANVFDKGAVDALRNKLTFTSGSGGKARAFGQSAQGSLLYPLAVANLVGAAMNMAVSIGAPLVTAELVMEA